MPESKAFGFTAVLIILWIVAAMVIAGFLVAAVVGSPAANMAVCPGTL